MDSDTGDRISIKQRQSLCNHWKFSNFKYIKFSLRRKNVFLEMYYNCSLYFNKNVCYNEARSWKKTIFTKFLY